MGHCAEKLPISRWQRDLSDSTVLRNIGVIMGHSILAYQSLERGLTKLKVNAKQIQLDLDCHWEVLAEAIQTVMRRYGLPQPYEQLKQLTRGQTITQETLQAFVDTLELPIEAKQRLKQLRPQDYIGLASQLALSVRQ